MQTIKTKKSFGKVAYNSKLKVNLIEVSLEISQKPVTQQNWDTLDAVHGPIQIAMSADVWNATKTDVVLCGQCLDEILPFLPGNLKFQRIHDLWKEWHMNDFKTGTKKQMDIVKHYFQDRKYDYDEACILLQGSSPAGEGLLSDRGYQYGSGWLYMPPPQAVIDELIQLFK